MVQTQGMNGLVQVGITYNKGNARLVRNLCNGLQIRHVIPRVTDRLDEYGLGLLVDSGLDILGLVTVDELGVDAQTGQEDLELVVGTTVEVRGGHDVVAGVSEGVDDDELGGLARGGGEGRNAPF